MLRLLLLPLGSLMFVAWLATITKPQNRQRTHQRLHTLLLLMLHVVHLLQSCSMVSSSSSSSLMLLHAATSIV
jgi:hypothetical protein